MNYKYFTSDGCKYEGMDDVTIRRLRTDLGKETVFVDEPTYLELIAYLQSH